MTAPGNKLSRDDLHFSRRVPGISVSAHLRSYVSKITKK